jgi:hypothetical protein
MSLIDTALLGAGRLTRARKRWGDAARLVSTRWEVFLAAEPGTRAFAFASYTAALNAEETAAAEMANLMSSHAAKGDRNGTSTSPTGAHNPNTPGPVARPSGADGARGASHRPSS